MGIDEDVVGEDRLLEADLVVHLLLPVDPAHDADLVLGGGVREPAGERHRLEHVGVTVAAERAGVLDLARDVADLGAQRR